MATYFETELGKLYNCDCLDVMKELGDKSIDLVFTDLPVIEDKYFKEMNRIGKKVIDYCGEDFTGFTQVEKRIHPEQKSVRFYYQRISECGGDSVLEPFMGSGAVVLACELLGRRWTGVEKDKNLCDSIIKRFKEEIEPLRKIFKPEG